MPDIFVSTYPFSDPDTEPLRRLEASGLTFQVNPLGRKLKRGEMRGFLENAKAVIAGTDPITREDLAGAAELRLISRVGSGLDSIDLAAARDRGVAVAYTPDAPAPAVAELTLGLLLDLARGITRSDREIRRGAWIRPVGRRLGRLTVGVVGAGRIGFRVIQLLRPFQCRILAHDLYPVSQVGPDLGVEWRDLGSLLRDSDMVTLHVPLTASTRGLIGPAELAAMRSGAALVNTSRGGVVDEEALCLALREGRLQSAALDVFAEEPYRGPLATLENVILSPHAGSHTDDCRVRMEIEAVEAAIGFLKGQPLRNPVPPEFYPR